MIPSAHGPILHGPKQNSRGILTFRKNESGSEVGLKR
jgi:hypothetical protein